MSDLDLKNNVNNNNNNKLICNYSEEFYKNNSLNNNKSDYAIDKCESKKSPIKNRKNSNARERWKILAHAIINETEYERESSVIVSNNNTMPADILSGLKKLCSTRSFNSFELIEQEPLKNEIKIELIGNDENWYTYRMYHELEEFIVNIHQMNRCWTAEDLIGFNNTGNICVWPSEEALSFYLLDNMKNYENSWVLELGGGMTCLAGLLIAKYGNPFLVHLTDGNMKSLENVKKSTRINGLDCFVKCSVLKWGCRENLKATHPTENGKYDLILSADCLFFDDCRNALVDTIYYFLTLNGEALVIAPKRGHTMSSFIINSKHKGFHCEIMTYYNKEIWNRHQELLLTDEYNENIHYPVLVKLTRNNNNNFNNGC